MWDYSSSSSPAVLDPTCAQSVLLEHAEQALNVLCRAPCAISRQEMSLQGVVSPSTAQQLWDLPGWELGAPTLSTLGSSELHSQMLIPALSKGKRHCFLN